MGPPTVDHPLDQVPDFWRLDLITKNGRHVKPKQKESEGTNELLNPEVLTAFFDKVFHSESEAYLSVSILKFVSVTQCAIYHQHNLVQNQAVAQKAKREITECRNDVSTSP